MIAYLRNLAKAILGVNTTTTVLRNVPSRNRVQGSYDVAKSNDDHWRPADLLSAAAANDPDTLKHLRRKARYETANNSHCRGTTLTLANDVVGLGPQLQTYLGEAEEDYEEHIENAWQAWADEISLSEKLMTMALAKIVDGESFAILSTNKSLRSRVKLDITLVEADRVTTPDFWAQRSNPLFADGIEFDQATGSPTVYHILKVHPGDGGWSEDAAAFDRVPAWKVLHWFRRDRPGQVRGIPEIMPALPLFSQLRRYTLAVLEAAESAADFAIILHTDAHPRDGAGNPVMGEAFESVSIDKGMMVTAPGGYKPSQLKPEQPAATHDAFQKTILREIFHALNMPYSVGSGDYSEDSFSSGRLGMQVYLRSIKQVRHHMKLGILDRIFAAWLEEAILLGVVQLPVSRFAGGGMTHDWYFDPFPSIDPLKDAKASELDLTNGVTTQMELCAERKRDWRKINRQRERELNDQKKRGIVVERDTQSPDLGVADAA